MDAIKKAAAFVVVVAIFAGVQVAVWFGRLRRNRRGTTKQSAHGIRLLVAGTFYNTGWFRSHMLPLSLCRNVEAIWVVSDSALEAVAKVSYATPPEWLARLVSRVPARLLWILRTAWCERCDVLMGYHIMPNSLLCLVAGALLGRPAIYQMTGGPAQIVGGGAASENVLLRQLRRESPFLERRLMGLVSAFDAVIVRGARARRFLEAQGLKIRIAVLTGSVDLERFTAERPLRYDVIFVGRLVEAKGCDLLQEVLAGLVAKRPGVSAAVVGDGPLESAMKEHLAAVGALPRVAFLGRRDDVPDLLAESLVFLLTSPDEGMSIALLEAMTAGVVPVVPDVGELGEAVRHGENGFVVATRQPEDFVEPIVTLLDDQPLRTRLGASARNWARDNVASCALAVRWERLLEDLFPSLDALAVSTSRCGASAPQGETGQCLRRRKDPK
jgi:glycosyltransferase involved in cell wall biosynthesis